MSLVILLVVYSLAMVASSLLGGCLPGLFRLTHVRMQVMLSFVGGTMLGVGLLHMLAHSIVELGSMDAALLWTLGGLLGMFLLIRTFHFHEHGVATVDEQQAGQGGDFEAACQGHSHHDHAHHGHSHEGHSHGAGSSLSWVSLFGFGTFLAILLHKPLDAVSITSLMMGSGWNPRGRFWVNAGFAAMCPLGAAIFYFGMSGLHPSAVDSALAFSAGIFLCISLSDLLPEMEFHAHNRVRLTAALLAGILLAYGITFLEPAHLH